MCPTVFLLSKFKNEESPIATAISATSAVKSLIFNIRFLLQNKSLKEVLVKWGLHAYSKDNLISSINSNDQKNLRLVFLLR